MSDHYPVMLTEVLEYLAPQNGGVYVDGTFGAGGYSRAILEAADCRVFAIDRDENALPVARGFAEEFGERFRFLPGCFGDVATLLAAAGVKKVDGLVLDLGVSSMQLDQPDRGFSFRFDGPLDMRMGQGGESAADLVNNMSEKELADGIYYYGEERFSRRIARKIVEARAQKPFETTLELAALIREVVPRSRKDDLDPATRSFQALRIMVNDELGQLEHALAASVSILSCGGCLVVVSFHSLEDRIVKRFLKNYSGALSASRYAPEPPGEQKLFEALTKKAVMPSSQEISENARSRSARLRAARFMGDAHAA